MLFGQLPMHVRLQSHHGATFLPLGYTIVGMALFPSLDTMQHHIPTLFISQFAHRHVVMVNWKLKEPPGQSYANVPGCLLEV